MRKNIIITGAAQGQGLSHACEFAKNGYNVVIADIFGENDKIMIDAVNKVKKYGNKAIAVKCDVTKGDEVEKTFSIAADKFSTIDVVISNAGIMTFGATWELTEEQVFKTIDINMIGTWRVNKESAKYMMKQKKGRIINVASTAGLKGTPNLAHYVMSKFGVIGLTKTLAKELARYGITVNAICPTIVKSAMTNNPKFLEYLEHLTGNKYTSFEQAEQQLKKTRPMGVSFLDPEYVSKLCLWLAESEEASYITGHTIPLDAGTML